MNNYFYGCLHRFCYLYQESRYMQIYFAFARLSWVIHNFYTTSYKSKHDYPFEVLFLYLYNNIQRSARSWISGLFLYQIIKLFRRDLWWISSGQKLTHNENERQLPSVTLNEDRKNSSISSRQNTQISLIQWNGRFTKKEQISL